MSLRRQFALALAGFAVVLAAMFSILTWRISSDALEAEMDRRLVALPGALVATETLEYGDVMNFTFPGAENDPYFEAYRFRLQGLRQSGYVADAFVFDAVGKTNLVSADPGLGIGDTIFHLRSYEADITRALDEGWATTDVFPLDDTLFKYGFVRMAAGGTAVVAVLIPADFYQPLARLRRVLLVGSLAALLVAAGLAGLMAAGVVRPLERLARVALRIQRGHMDVEVASERGDEVGRLARAMERMRQGILERDEQLRLMLAQVAHEIRNPLGGLELFASAAAEADEPAERARLLGRVRGEVTALNRIIDDFLTYARPIRARRRATDLREPLRDAAELAEAEVRASGRTLDVRLSPDPLMAVVDDDQVKRAVLNLLRNAGQAAESRVLLRADYEATEIAVVVTDDGPGIPEEERERVFEPFITDKEKGAGLGLAIVRKVVEAHGGRVELGDPTADGFGRGAEFRIYFVGLEEPPPDLRDPQS